MRGVRLRRVATLVTEVEHQAPAPYVALEAVEQWTGRLSTEELPERDPAQGGAFSVRPGDVLFGKLRPYLAKSWLVDCGALASSELLAIRPASEALVPRYLGYLAQSRRFVEWAVATSDGTKMPRTSWEDLREYELWLPPLPTQRAIADYLDAETARIDGLIARKRRMIELLDERVDSLVMSWVGRSSLVGSGAVGAVPIRRALAKLERWAPEGEMVTAFRDGEVMTRSARGREGFTDAWTEGARFQVVRVGDVVVHGLDGFSGAIGDSQSDGVCSPVYHVCRPVSGGDPAYYGRLLRLLALSGYLGNFATSTRERAVDFRNWDLFGRTPVPDVPIADQLRIGDLIRAARPLRDKVRTSETLAMERRQALVTAVFTGELAVPEAVA